MDDLKLQTADPETGVFKDTKMLSESELAEILTLNTEGPEAVTNEAREVVKRLAAANANIREVAKSMSPGLVESLRNTLASTRQFVDAAAAHVDSPIPGMSMTEYRHWKRRMAYVCHRHYMESKNARDEAKWRPIIARDHVARYGRLLKAVFQA